MPKGAFLPKTTLITLNGYTNLAYSNTSPNFLGDQEFRGNSISDWNMQATDFLLPPTADVMRYYKYCRIYKSKISVTMFKNALPSTVIPRQWIVALIPNTEANSYGSASFNYNSILPIIEQQKYVKYKYWQPDDAQGKPLKLKNSMKTKTMYPKELLSAADNSLSFGYTVNGNIVSPNPPVNQWYWHLVTQDVSQVGLTGQLNTRVIVHIQYKCILADQADSIVNSTIA